MDAHDINHAVIQFRGVFKSGFYVNRSAAKLRPHVVVELPAEFDKIQISSLFHFRQSAAVAKVREQAIEKIALRHPQVPANVFQATALYFHEAASDGLARGPDETEMPPSSLFPVPSEFGNSSRTNTANKPWFELEI
jgi:hypothetical protein